MSIQRLKEDGFCISENVFSMDEVDSIIKKITSTSISSPAFRRTNDLFAIRRFMHELPDTMPLIFNKRLQSVIHQLFGPDYFPVKSIYFDKPGQSNWFVAYHQDLTISVKKKIEYPGFSSWTVKQNQFAVQPPLDILENIFTIRIHLDDTDENNGALKVIPGSHRKGIVRPEDSDREKEVICKVKRGGVMIMKPLLLHASGRTLDARNRRVIHIEFSNRALPDDMGWAERL